MDTPAQRFDLRAYSDYYQKFSLPGKIFTLALGNGFLLFWLLLLPALWAKTSADLTHGVTSDLTLQIAFLLTGPIIGAACNYIGLAYIRRSATGVVVDHRGVTFEFLKTSEEYSWRSPRFDLTIRDSRANPNVAPLLRLGVTLPRRGLVPLPVEAVEAIRAEATSQGLVVTDGKGGNEFDMVSGTSTIRIRAARNTKS
jgi:hypothetical protein